MAELFANFINPDQMPHSAASDLGLLCLSINLLGFSRLKLFNANNNFKAPDKKRKTVKRQRHLSKTDLNKQLALATFQIQSTLVISNFTGPDKNVRVISSSRQPNCDVIGMTTVRLSVRQNVHGRHMYMAI